jgi:hypothetical protein
MHWGEGFGERRDGSLSLSGPALEPLACARPRSSFSPLSLALLLALDRFAHLVLVLAPAFRALFPYRQA